MSTSVTWDELDDPVLKADRWTVRTVLYRIEERGDLFRGVQHLDQKLLRVK